MQVDRQLAAIMALALSIAAVAVATALPASATSLREAVQLTVRTNPSIAAARANSRAVGYEVLQAEGRLYPQIDVAGDTGRQLVDRPGGLSPANNDQWRTRWQVGVTVRQVLFDAWDRANDIYRASARLDSSAHRVMERAEVLALDAVEAYIDVRRHSNVLAIAQRNVSRHRQLLRLVQERVDGGKTVASEAIQTRERIAAAEAVVEQIRQSLLEAVAKFRRVVGIDPKHLDPVGYPGHIPTTRDQAVALAAISHPALKAADADIDTAHFALEQSRSANMPVVALEGRANYGRDLDGTPGRDEDYQAKVVLNWRLFDGRIGESRQLELAERRVQAMAERDAQRRAIEEAIDRSLAAYRIGGERVGSLRRRQNESQRVVVAYEDEYKLSKRSLIDLLDAENSLFSARFQLESVRAVHIFSAYQLIASTGHLLENLDVAPPPETTPVVVEPHARPTGLELEPLRK